MYAHDLFLERVQRALVDGVAVFVSLLLAVWIRHSSGWIPQTTATPWSTYLFPAVVIASLAVVVLQASGSYREPHRVVPMRVLLAALGASTATALAMSFFYRAESYSRATVLIFMPVAVLVVTGTTHVYAFYVKAVWQNKAATRRLLIVGRTTSGMQLASALERRPVYYKMVGFVDDASDLTGNGSQPQLLGKVSELGRIVEELAIEEVLICLPDDPDRVMRAIGECMRHKVSWKAMPNMYGLRLDRMSVESYDGIPLIGPHDKHPIGFSRMMKRGFDVVVAAAALILLSPILLAVAFTVRITSRGPALFKQTRVGLNGRPFTMLKFRSMKNGTPTEIHNEYTREWIYGRSGSSGNGSSGGNATDPAGSSSDTHKLTDDPRITSVGKFLRATSLDELPQFWNVLRGDMSIVGPRPALPYEVDRYTEWHKRRLTVLPGITGAWQVSGRSNLAFDEMVALDVDYIEQWSIGRDFELMLRTVPAVLRFGGK